MWCKAMCAYTPNNRGNFVSRKRLTLQIEDNVQNKHVDFRFEVVLPATFWSFSHVNFRTISDFATFLTTGRHSMSLGHQSWPLWSTWLEELVKTVDQAALLPCFQHFRLDFFALDKLTIWRRDGSIVLSCLVHWPFFGTFDLLYVVRIHTFDLTVLHQELHSPNLYVQKWSRCGVGTWIL